MTTATTKQVGGFMTVEEDSHFFDYMTDDRYEAMHLSGLLERREGESIRELTHRCIQAWLEKRSQIHCFPDSRNWFDNPLSDVLWSEHRFMQDLADGEDEYRGFYDVDYFLEWEVEQEIYALLARWYETGALPSNWDEWESEEIDPRQLDEMVAEGEAYNIKRKGLTHEKMEKMASRLDEMQKEKNNGRGVVVVRNITFWLRMNQLGAAKHLANSNNQELEKYPDICNYLFLNW